MARIFISYSRVDNEDGFVKYFVERLRKGRPDDEIWWDEELRGGDVWWKEILNQIKQRDIFLYLLSNESVNSPYCQAEYFEARRLQKLILTLQVRGRTNIPDELSEIQYVDMTSADKTDAFISLFAALAKLTSAIPRRRPRPLWSQPTQRPRKIPSVEEEKAATPDTASFSLPAIPPLRSMIAASWWRSPIFQVPIAILTIITIGLEVLSLANGGLSPTNTPSGVANSSSLTPSLTATNGPTPTETPTLQIGEIVGTLDSQATVQQATLFAASTDAARATAYAVGTESILNQTATATLWTATPTPNITASIEAYRTQQAATGTAQYALNQTATVDAYTDTPMPSSTPTLNPALQAAEKGVQGNLDWRPYDPYIQQFGAVDMVLVPAGCFDMGSENGSPDEKPLTHLCINVPFWIDRTEVTNDQFAAFDGVAANPSSWTNPKRPRQNIMWFEARDYCYLRGTRLPNEVEWEYAARGPDDLVYPWGNSFVPDNVVYRDNSNNEIADVGSKPGGASWVGALDMSGNVWEWVSSLYRSYPYIYTDGRENLANKTEDRVLRGGSWYRTQFEVRTTARSENAPGKLGLSPGFRCARDFDG